MKKISDFEDCRMDMKNMAALNGGSATSGSSSTSTYANCGDQFTYSYKDGYRNVTGKSEFYTYDEKYAYEEYACPEDGGEDGDEGCEPGI